MSRLLALSLLALAAPCAAAQQVHPCQAETPPCSLAMAQARLYLDELDRNAGNFVAPDHYEYLTINRERNSPRQASNSDLALVLLEMARMQVEMMASEQDLEKVLELIKSARAHVPPDEVEALLELEEQLRETGPGSAAWARSEWYRKSKRTPKPRYHVPYPLSRELLTGAVNPCKSAYPSCPPKLDRIYDGLSEARRRDDQSLLKMYQRKLRYYYYEHRP